MAVATRFRPLYAPNGAIISKSMIAGQSGIDILQQGGTAMDAAVAVSGSVNCHDPCSVTALVVPKPAGPPVGFAAVMDDSDLNRALAGMLLRYGLRSLYDLCPGRDYRGAASANEFSRDSSWTIVEPKVSGPYRLFGTPDRSGQPRPDEHRVACDIGSQTGSPDGVSSLWAMAVDHRGMHVHIDLAPRGSASRKPAWIEAEDYSMLISCPSDWRGSVTGLLESLVAADSLAPWLQREVEAVTQGAAILSDFRAGLVAACGGEGVSVAAY